MYTALWLYCTLLAPAPAKPAPHHTSYPAAKLKGIKVASAGGSISLRGTRTGNVAIDAKQTLGGPACTLSTQVQQGVLSVTVSAPSNAPCQMELDIGLPRRLHVEIQNDAGNLFVSGPEGDVAVNLSQGNAVLGGKIKHLKATLARGSLSAQGLLGDVELTLGQGNAQLWFEGTPHATVSLEVERGNVTVGSNAAKIDAHINIEAGQLQTPLPQSANAALHIKGHVARGNVIVRASR